MTLAGIIQLALHQLDEAPEETANMADSLRLYANAGYHLAVTQYLHPQECLQAHTDENGRVDLNALAQDVCKVVGVLDERGRNCPFAITWNGRYLMTDQLDAPVWIEAEVEKPPLVQDTQVPDLPEVVHPALADYVCYCLLSHGSIAKQQRADRFLQRFHQMMQSVRPRRIARTMQMHGLYAMSQR